MEEKVERILAITESINRRLEKDDTVLGKILRFGEKLIIPIMLGLLAFVANSASNRIAESQLELAKQESALRETQFQTQIQTKYLEIFYDDINSGNSTKQGNAIELLKLMDDQLAATLAGLVERKSDIPNEVRFQATEIKRNIETLAPLSGYKIGIYPMPTNTRSKSFASDISDRLRQKGFKGNIQIYDKNLSFFQSVGIPNGYEIRYEPQYEDTQADLLQSLLKDFFPDVQFIKRRVKNRTKGFISVFLS